MPDTKTIVAKNAAIGVPCQKKSVLKKDDNGKTVAGEYAHVELKHVKPGESVTIDAAEADHLIALGFAVEVKASASDQGKPTK